MEDGEEVEKSRGEEDELDVEEEDEAKARLSAGSRPTWSNLY